MTLELASSTAEPFEIGDWAVAPDRNHIRREGRVVRLEPLSMRLLCLLAENAGRTVSRAEIVHRLWGGRAVTEDAIGRQIAKLRDAFDDDARRPRVIQTVPKVGVLLLPPVRPAGGSSRGAEMLVDRPAAAAGERLRTEAPPRPLASASGIGPAAAPLTPPQGRSRLAAACAAAVLVLALGGLIQFQRSPGSQDAAEIPLTALVGVEQDPALSPNGAMLAYVSDAEPDGFGLYARRVAQDDAKRLTTTGFDGCKPAWSPEGDRVAFVRHLHGKAGCELAVISPVSLQLRVVAKCRDARGGGLAWAGPAGLVFADRSGDPSRRFRLYRAPLDGGVPVALTNPPPGSSGDIRPVYAPESRSVYFLRGVGADVSEVFRLDLKTGEVAQVTHERSNLLGLSSGGPGRLLVSAHNRADLPPALWSLDVRRDRWTRRATGGEYWKLASSADGRVVVFERPRSRFALVSYDVANKTASQLTRTNRAEWLPALSPGGGRLAFISSRSGAQQVWTASADGSGAEQLTFLEQGSPEEIAWSPDGRTLVLSLGLRGQYDLLRADAQSGALTELSRSPASDEQSPFFAHDGALYFTRKTRTGSRLIRREPGTERESVVASGVVRAVPAEDGAFYVTRPEREGIWRLTGDGAFVRAAPFPALAPARNWTYREGAIWTLSGGALTRVNPLTGRTAHLGVLDAAFGLSGLDVRNGRVVYARRDDFDIDLYRLGG